MKATVGIFLRSLFWYDKLFSEKPKFMAALSGMKAPAWRIRPNEPV